MFQARIKGKPRRGLGAGSAKGMANRFVKALNAGLMPDRTQPGQGGRIIRVGKAEGLK